MAELVLTDISKRYGRATAVDRVSLQVADGEFMVLVGPSGCGKSTILRLVAGLEHPDSGDISLDGRSVLDIAPKDRDMAMVFQNYALYPHMTVFQNMAFSLQMRKTAKTVIDRQVREAAAILGLDDLLDRRAGRLSGGQQQRVALGRAMVRRPRLFLLDEPLSNLDARLRATMRAELIQLHRRLGVTMLYVTHDQTEAMGMADRLAVLDRGRLLQVGESLAVYRKPVDIFVASFLGSPAMNFFPCSLEEQDGRAVLVAANISLPVAGDALQLLRRADLPAGRVIVGLRPEHFQRIDTSAAHGCAAIMARVEYLEPLGSETLAGCSAGGSRFVCRLDATDQETVRAGDPVTFAVTMEAVSFFHPTTTKRIGP